MVLLLVNGSESGGETATCWGNTAWNSLARTNWGWAGNLCTESIGECRRGTGRRAVSRGSSWWTFAAVLHPTLIAFQGAGPDFLEPQPTWLLRGGRLGGECSFAAFKSCTFFEAIFDSVLEQTPWQQTRLTLSLKESWELAAVLVNLTWLTHPGESTLFRTFWAAKPKARICRHLTNEWNFEVKGCQKSIETFGNLISTCKWLFEEKPEA